MREIKFRAWSKEEKAFIAGFNLFNFHSYYNAGIEPHIERYSLSWKLSEIELMQFTGLKDKNGELIYEGDIITDYLGHKYAVVFADGGFWCEYPNGEKFLPAIEYREIIGNIYQNPKLCPTTNH